MLKITVQRDGTGDFTTISEAVQAVPYECEAEIEIGPGIYREKLVCEKQNITLRGAGADQTRVVWGDGGKLPHPDGRPTHTFRSYTAFFSGENLTVEDLTIENDAGPGAQVGQAVAAYVDSARAVFRRVKLLGNAMHHIGEDGLFFLRAFKCPEGVRVEVEDHGPGISAEDLPYIFDRYYRSRSDAGKQGTGLGLSITKAIFQQHGFRFGVQSTVGKGTTFWFIMTDTDSSDN